MVFRPGKALCLRFN